MNAYEVEIVGLCRKTKNDRKEGNKVDNAYYGNSFSIKLIRSSTGLKYGSTFSGVK